MCCHRRLSRRRKIYKNNRLRITFIKFLVQVFYTGLLSWFLKYPGFLIRFPVQIFCPDLLYSLKIPNFCLGFLPRFPTQISSPDFLSRFNAQISYQVTYQVSCPSCPIPDFLFRFPVQVICPVLLSLIFI